ncbi:aldo/keto reductase [Mucor ambiguus]|uniref:Aldo/keto reductase n=1 Tax=Mucor ambiguus TaxID=91626 RepID=A0A0C9M1S4_9FUNG|nr:aldo/keto reductase [Mucor ambiguus]
MSSDAATSPVPQMKYVRLGNTGLRVSRLCLGCMSFGLSAWSPWVKEEKEAIEVIREAAKLGVNFFDTADTYSNGVSEEILGKAIKGMDRSRIVIATKVFGPVFDDVNRLDRTGMKEDPALVNRIGLSRKHIFDAVDASLKRLDVDYIDLYQIHRLDKDTPMEEIMEALNDVVRSGKVRYIGASSMDTWEFQKLNSIAEKNGWAQFVSMQNLYNLLYREEEREMAPYCLDARIGWIPWSPLAMGELVGKNRSSTRSSSTLTLGMFKATRDEIANNSIIDRVQEIAQKYNATNAQIALAWEYTKPYVSSPIVGVSRIEQLKDLIGALDVKLTEEDVKYLEEPYSPKTISTE